LNSVLHYDANASRALSIFPEIDGSSPSSSSSFTNNNSFDEMERPSAGTKDITDEQVDTNLMEGGGGGSVGVNEGGVIGRGGSRRCETLFGILNVAKTQMGSRLLRRWVQQPLYDRAKIRERQRAIAALVYDPIARNRLRDSTENLLRCPDLEKLGKSLITE
jgi:hypothetical protein